MDIGGINRIKAPATAVAPDPKRQNQTAADRDAHGHTGYESQKKATHLTAEQEEAALKALNALPGFTKAGLVGTIVKEEGKAPHIVVKDAQGNVVRHIPYANMIELYANRKDGSEKGQLLRKAA